MTTEEQEHYSFGPWLIQITNEALIPTQYQSYKLAILDADFSIKVPIKKDRNQISPGMLMYKEILCFYKDHFSILYSTDQGILKKTIHYSDILFVIQGGELLNNYILITAKNEVVQIDYYTISFELTNRIIQLLRDTFPPSKNGNIQGLSTPPLLDKNPLYTYFVQTQSSITPVRIIGHQQKSRARYLYKTTKDLLKIFSFKTIDEVMFLANANELIVLSGDIDKTRQATVDYSYRHIYIRLDSISDMHAYPNNCYKNLIDLTIVIDHQILTINLEDSFDIRNLKVINR